MQIELWIGTTYIAGSAIGPGNLSPEPPQVRHSKRAIHILVLLSEPMK
jgi:hypothetical protein